MRAAVADAPRSAKGVVACELTLVECERVLIRAWGTGLITEAERVDQGVRESGSRLGFLTLP